MYPKITAPAPYTLLTPLTNVTYDPVSGVVVTKFRTGFRQQHVSLRDGLQRNTLLSQPVADSVGVITVVDATFDGADELFLGDFIFENGFQYNAVIGDINGTAAALATAINNTGAFAASAVGNVISVTGPAGLQGRLTKFKVITRSSTLQLQVSGNGFLEGSEPSIGPREVLP